MVMSTDEEHTPCLICGDGIIKTEVKSGVNSAFFFCVWGEKNTQQRVLLQVLLLYGHS